MHRGSRIHIFLDLIGRDLVSLQQFFERDEVNEDAQQLSGFRATREYHWDSIAEHANDKIAYSTAFSELGVYLQFAPRSRSKSLVGDDIDHVV